MSEEEAKATAEMAGLMRQLETAAEESARTLDWEEAGTLHARDQAAAESEARVTAYTNSHTYMHTHTHTYIHTYIWQG